MIYQTTMTSKKIKTDSEKVFTQIVRLEYQIQADGHRGDFVNSIYTDRRIR